MPVLRCHDERPGRRGEPELAALQSACPEMLRDAVLKSAWAREHIGTDERVVVDQPDEIDVSLDRAQNQVVVAGSEDDVVRARDQPDRQPQVRDRWGKTRFIPHYSEFLATPLASDSTSLGNYSRAE